MKKKEDGGSLSIELMRNNRTGQVMLFLGLNDEYFVPLSDLVGLFHEVCPDFPIWDVEACFKQLTMRAGARESEDLNPHRSIQ